MLFIFVRSFIRKLKPQKYNILLLLDMVNLRLKIKFGVILTDTSKKYVRCESKKCSKQNFC